MLITAPGGDRPYPGLTTTDMTGAYGGCSSVFSGLNFSVLFFLVSFFFWFLIFLVFYFWGWVV